MQYAYKKLEEIRNITEFEVKLCQNFMYTDLQIVHQLIHTFTHRIRYNQQLYALL